MTTRRYIPGGIDWQRRTVVERPTIEPIRPIFSNGRKVEGVPLVLGGGYRVFYGWHDYPSYSYTTFGTEID
jgi:hypothetical protein